jgi:hypothetical protein
MLPSPKGECCRAWYAVLEQEESFNYKGRCGFFEFNDKDGGEFHFGYGRTSS